MNNIVNSIMKFLKNKNTVTIIGVIIVLGLLYWGYSSQVKAAVNPVTIPVARTTIQPRKQITQDMITTIEIASIAVVENVYTNTNQIVGKYSNVNTIIPKGSMFYREALIEKDQLPDSAFFNIPEGTIPYLFPVNMETTFGNSIFPGSKIDIYMKAVNDDRKVMVGKFIEDVEVIAVRDGAGRDVFENTDENRTPAYLLFALPDELHILMRKAVYISSNAIVLIPIPHGGTITSEGEIRVSIEYLREFINANSVILEGQEGYDPTEFED